MKKDDPDDPMKQLCDEITVLLERNEDLDRQLKELKQIEDPTEVPSSEMAKEEPSVPPENVSEQETAGDSEAPDDAL